VAILQGVVRDAISGEPPPPPDPVPPKPVVTITIEAPPGVTVVVRQ